MKELLDQITVKAEGRAADIAKIEQRITAQQKSVEAAQNEAADAFDRMDVTGYHAAQDKQRAGQDAVKMLEKRLEKIKEAPRMTPEEYKDMEHKIRSEYADTLQQIREQVAEHIKAIAELNPKLTETWKTGQKALHELQYNVMNDAPFVLTGSGKKAFTPQADKRLPGMDFEGEACAMLNAALKGEDPLQRWSK